jgi:hypothetical protein
MDIKGPRLGRLDSAAVPIRRTGKPHGKVVPLQRHALSHGGRESLQER